MWLGGHGAERLCEPVIEPQELVRRDERVGVDEVRAAPAEARQARDIPSSVEHAGGVGRWVHGDEGLEALRRQRQQRGEAVAHQVSLVLPVHPEAGLTEVLAACDLVHAHGHGLPALPPVPHDVAQLPCLREVHAEAGLLGAEDDLLRRWRDLLECPVDDAPAQPWVDGREARKEVVVHADHRQPHLDHEVHLQGYRQESESLVMVVELPLHLLLPLHVLLHAHRQRG
mmetsp:Transcript_105807/g.341350  ORF Transcript_105807/g.341350 Transcript_105807/m.341350 type:complete len:228 (+) Transcript_105807:163-846(+)